MGLDTTTAHPGLLHVVLCEPVTMVGAAASLWQVLSSRLLSGHACEIQGLWVCSK